MIENEDNGTRITTEWVAQRVNVPTYIAELFLSKLEKDLVTEWLPSIGARLVERRPDGATDMESCMEEEEPEQPTGHTGSQPAAAATPSVQRSKARMEGTQGDLDLSKLSISKTIAKGKKTVQRAEVASGRKQSQTIHKIDGRKSHASSSGASRGRR